MKAIILNGSLKNHTHLTPVQKLLEKAFENYDWQVESIPLHSTTIETCIGCFKCWISTPGVCFREDQGRDVAKKAINSHLLVFLTPLTWGGYSSELKKAIERMLGLIHPYFIRVKGSCRHGKRYDAYPSILGVAVSNDKKDEEGEKVFEALIERHSLNWHSPRQKALVVYNNEDKQEILTKLNAILAELEVVK